MRKILITGTSKGIGKKLAEYYLSKKDLVFGCSRSNSTIDNIHYHHYELNISDEKSVISLVNKISKITPEIDVLVNNAGIATMNHILTTPMTSVREIFETNMFGTFLLTREVGKIMKRQGCGRIVNCSTIAVPLALEGESIYAASKSAVETFTKVIAAEYARYGITVNAIGPTPIDTNLISSIPKSKIRTVIEKQIVQRYGSIEDIANVIDFFIDEKSSFITAQVLYLGGVKC